MTIVDLRQLEQAFRYVGENVAVPIRRPSYHAPPFWSIGLTITQARPLPIPAAAPGDWLDFLVIPDKDLHKKVVKAYVAASFNDSPVVEFRWIRDGNLLYPREIALDPAVEHHLDRTAALPFPCTFRAFYILGVAGGIENTDRSLKLQARNLTVENQLAFAAVYGHYYPAFRAPNEYSEFEGIDDSSRAEPSWGD